MESENLPKRKSWAAELIVALIACVFLVLYFNPKQHDDLVCIEGHEKPNAYYETQGIFPGSWIFVNRSYRVITLTQQPTQFLLDVEMPWYYTAGENLRLWIIPKDQQRILEDPDIKVRVYAFECYDPDTQQWTRYTAEHPRGNGLFLAIGIVLTILCLVMVVNKICFTRAEDIASH